MAVTERSALSAMTLGLSEVHLFTNSLIISCLDTMYLDHTNPILPCEVLPTLTAPSPRLQLLISQPTEFDQCCPCVHRCKTTHGSTGHFPPDKGGLPMPGALNFQSFSAGDGVSGVFSPSMLEWLDLIQWKYISAMAMSYPEDIVSP